MSDKPQLKEVDPNPVEEKAEVEKKDETVESTKDESVLKPTEDSKKSDDLATGQKPAVTKDDAPPPVMPARPASPFSQGEATLAEAFPSIDAKVRRAVLVASGGDVEAAFTALLSMSDPNFKPEEAIAQANERKASAEKERSLSSKKKAQIEEDERLARQLASQYSTGGSSRRSGQRTSFGTGRYDDPLPAEQERSFFDDDLPEIKRSLEEGFNETKEKVNSWVANFRNKINQDQRQGKGLFSAFNNNDDRQYQDRVAQRERHFDRDTDEISDDFHGISLREEDQDVPPPPPPKRPTVGTASVATVQPVSALGDSTTAKWEPLKADTDATAENDKDAFFIGESDDDEDLDDLVDNKKDSSDKK